MPTTIPIHQCWVAIKNTGPVTLHRPYDKKNYEFPRGGKITVISYEVALHIFGFELSPKGVLFRNEREKYETGEDTCWYSARANFLPWGWSIDTPENEKPFNPRAPKDKQVSKREMFELLKDTWENHIEARLIAYPKELSDAQFNELPASGHLEPVTT
ncbi:MAG TPA: hypothetical protein VK673_21765 [Chthoniobacterales bacterium]|nr:hypothetical protein [Chthoniobacterales bacterium]